MSNIARKTRVEALVASSHRVRDFTKVLRLPALLTTLVLFAGCAIEPWVKPYERQNLADPIMNFDRDPIASSYMHHVYQAREGARGAEGGAGGGCGCN